MQDKPNVVLVFADQLRLQSLGYAGDPNARTPRIDALEKQSVSFTTAVSGCPVCSPARASLITGQYPDKHGVIVNDVYLEESPHAMGHIFKSAGYHTAYIGKWHIDGHGHRYGYIPPERRQGFDYWKALECTHRYMKSSYYENNSKNISYWKGYDALAQTKDACGYIKNHDSTKPFCLVLSWGPPHTPGGPPKIPGPNVPERYLKMFDRNSIALRRNVTQDCVERARDDLASYYAHITALDDCTGLLLDTLEGEQLSENTIFVFWSDHGDMLGSQGQWKKQRPWDESILVPLLIRYPRLLGRERREITSPINTPDIFPTLLSLCKIAIPDSAAGNDYLSCIRGTDDAPADAALIACYQPFSQYPANGNGKEYRGLRTERYTYTRDLNGPWLLYDNENDPFQLDNLVDTPSMSHLRANLDKKLDDLLTQQEDEFLNGEEYMQRWGYDHDETGTPHFGW